MRDYFRNRCALGSVPQYPTIPTRGWLSNWTYRKDLSLTGQTGAGTDYQVKLLVGESSGATGENFDVAGHSASFPTGKNVSGDLRFAASDGTTLLPFWVESVSGTTPNRLATVWVKVSADLGTNQNIYCYYGGTTTNVSDGRDTFNIYDDFDGGTEQWTEVDPDSRISIDRTTNKRINFTNLDRYNITYLYKAITPPDNFLLEYDVNITFNQTEGSMYIGLADGLSGVNIIDESNFIASNFYHGTLKRFNLIVTGATETNVGGIDGTKYVRLTKIGNEIKLYAYTDQARTSLISGFPLTLTASFTGDLTYFFPLRSAKSTYMPSNSVSGWLTNYVVRKYLATEPSYSTSGSEES